jgi:hypothetical protein
MAESHAAGRGGLAGVGARIVPWRRLAIGIINVSDRLTALLLSSATVKQLPSEPVWLEWQVPLACFQQATQQALMATNEVQDGLCACRPLQDRKACLWTPDKR